MIEIVFLAVAIGAFYETAKKRATEGAVYIAVAIFGFFLTRLVSNALYGPGPGLIVSWVWVGVCYSAMFWIGGGGRRLKSSWQCPQCRLFNDPTTLVCPCGQSAPDTDELAPAEPTYQQSLPDTPPPQQEQQGPDPVATEE